MTINKAIMRIEAILMICLCLFFLTYFPNISDPLIESFVRRSLSLYFFSNCWFLSSYSYVSLRVVFASCSEAVFEYSSKASYNLLMLTCFPCPFITPSFYMSSIGFRTRIFINRAKLYPYYIFSL